MKYLVSVRLHLPDDKGEKIKKHNEQYLVDAVSVTDAEAKVTEKFNGATYDWEVVSARETKIVEYID
jgi:hypothetical protein